MPFNRRELGTDPGHRRPAWVVLKTLESPLSDSPPSSAKTPLTRYQWKLFAFLSVACLFEGYDFFALAQILPNLRADFGMSEFEGGLLVGAINVGTVVAYLLIRQTDRWGRRRMLMVTIVGYTIASFLTGLSWDPWSFGALQLIARVFLIAEWAVSMVYAAEEFPADRRGMVIGVIQAMTSLGAVTCAGVVPLLLQTDLGWRMVYLIGAVPLVIIMVWRRGLKETRRFEDQKKKGLGARPSIFAVFRTKSARRVVQMGVIWMLTYICTQTSITFWKEFAISERSMTDADVGLAITIGAVGSMPLVFFAGKLLDVVGRKIGATIIFTIASVSCVAMYNLESWTSLTAMLVLGIFGVSAVLPVLNTYSTELFPTNVRSDAFAWANNIIGRVGYVLAPLLVGFLAEDYGWGLSVSLTAIGPLIALGLIWLWLPETKGRELEEIAASEG